MSTTTDARNLTTIDTGNLTTTTIDLQHRKTTVIASTNTIDLNKEIIEQQNKVISDGSVDVPEAKVADAVMKDVIECMRTPRPTLYEQNETPGGPIYWEPHVEGILIPVEGTYYDIIDEALDIVSLNYIKSNKNVIGLRKSN
ncbi:hypothetical protein Tco_0610152 [Tanacetum coccineum]